MDSNKRQHLKWAVALSLKEKQWLNAAKSLPFPAHLLLCFSYSNLIYCYDWMEFALTAFRINCTGAIDSSWIHKITSFHYQQPDNYAFPLFFISGQKWYNSMCHSKTLVARVVSIGCAGSRNSSVTGTQKVLSLVRTKGNLLMKGITVHQQNSNYNTKTPAIAT